MIFNDWVSDTYTNKLDGYYCIHHLLGNVFILQMNPRLWYEGVLLYQKNIKKYFMLIFNVN